VHGPQGIEMHRAVDAAKDQSYVLGVLEQWQLERSLFPLGDTVKGEVRAEAERRGLTVAAKPDSHDICFIADGDTSSWLAERLGEQSGDIVDAVTGKVLGHHSGAYAFTVGQRRGLALGVPAADGAPRYVTSVDPSAHTVFVGPPTLLDINVIEGIKPHWCQGIPQAGTHMGVQVRAHGEEVPAVVRSADDVSALLSTEKPIRGLAAGQAAVMYDGTRVIGAVTVSKARRDS
jgi:tRNA-specific 2-thiouridylase